MDLDQCKLLVCIVTTVVVIDPCASHVFDTVNAVNPGSGANLELLGAHNSELASTDDTWRFCSSGYCYQIYSNPAREQGSCYNLECMTNFCKANTERKQYIASVHNSEVSSKIHDELRYLDTKQTVVVIGYYYSADSKQEVWVGDGTAMDYTNFAATGNNPDDYQCAAINTIAWDRRNCSNLSGLPFVCEFEGENPHTPCPDSLTPYPIKGEITSPGYPNFYVNGKNETCQYFIPGEKEYLVQLRVEEMITNGTDHINVYKGWDDDPQYEDLSSGSDGITPSTVGRIFTSDTYQMLLEFHRTPGGSGRWKLKYDMRRATISIVSTTSASPPGTSNTGSKTSSTFSSFLICILLVSIRI